MPEELREQVPLIKEMLSAMGINIMSLEGYEADDLLGTVARRSEAKGMDVTILSGDRDLLQLATYFIVHKAMQQLDEKQEDTVLDFKELLEEDIRKSRRYIRKKKFHRAIAAVAVCVLIAALVVFLVFVILELKEGI